MRGRILNWRMDEGKGGEISVSFKCFKIRNIFEKSNTSTDNYTSTDNFNLNAH